jgi:hypothetical protein
MDKLKIVQYKTLFDAIVQHIENEQKEQVELGSGAKREEQNLSRMEQINRIQNYF